MRDFGGRAWTEVDHESYNSKHDAFSCMNHETLRYYITGFLNTALHDPNSAAAEFIIYFAGGKRFPAFCDYLNTKQIKFLLVTIDWLLSGDYFGEDNRQQYAKQKDIVLNKHNLE